MNMEFLKTPREYGRIRQIKEQVFVLFTPDIYTWEMIPCPEGLLVPEISYITKYSMDGRMLSREYFGRGVFEYKSDCIYNHLGQLIKTVSTDPKGKEVVVNLTRYNEKGLEVESITFSESGKVDFVLTFRYDCASLLISVTDSFPDGRYDANIIDCEHLPGLRKRIITHSNPKGRITGKKIHTYNERGDFLSIQEYDEKGNMYSRVRKSFDMHDNLIMREVSSYSESGIKEIFHKYEHFFDSQNNWIKIHIYEDDVLETIIEREIDYY